MNFLLFTISLLLLAALQAGLPTLWWLGGLRIEFLPALVVYGALTLRRGGALALAIAAGLAQDAFSAGTFGLSALVYGAGALLMTELREILDRDLPWIQMCAGALTSAAVSVAAVVVIGLSFGAVIKILLLATIAAVMTPILFFALDWTRYAGRVA